MSGTMGSRGWLASFVLGILVLLACPGWAQVSAAISGKVEDTSGAAVSGATVKVRNLETDSTRVVTTDSAGNYRVLSLPVGVYELSVEKSGFETALWTGIKLNVGQEVVENLRLAVSEAVEEITVSANAPAPVVNTTTSSVSGMVGEEEINELPLNGRSFDQLITLNPGTIDFSSMRSANTTTSNGNAFAVDGQKPGDNETLLNGVEYGGSSQLAVTPGGVSGHLLGVDAVREFNVLTGTYGAEYGKHPGAQVIVVTKSGSNAVHGTLYEFLRNNVLNTRNYFDPGAATPFKQNQFGASLGGPIKKDKLFFFGNYEGFRLRSNATNLSFVPDNCVRGLVSGVPKGGIPNSSGVCVPVALAQSTMLQYAREFWPLPNGPELGGGTAKLFSNPFQSINEDFGTTRLDYILGERDTLSGSYTIDEGTSLIPLSDPYFASALDVGSQVFSLQETHIFSPRVVNAFTVGFSRAAFANNSAPTPAFLAQYDPSLDFVAGRGPGGITFNGVTTTGPSGAVTAAGPNNASGVWNRRNLFTYADNLQISHGIHQISLGVSIQWLQDNDDTASRLLGQASFTSLTNFLRGIASPFQVVPNSEELGWRTLMGAWYVQDAMRVRQNLTVELGLRHEFDTGWNEAHGRAANYQTDPSTGILETVPTIGSSAFTQNNAKWLFGPRVALAWDPYGDGTTAVHAGFGIYYSLLDALAYQLNAVPNGHYNGTYSYSGPLFGASGPLFNGAINPAAPPPGFKYSPQGVQPDAKTPTVEKWSLSIEQRLSNTMSLQIGYVGSFGYHEVISEDPNSLMPVLCTFTAGCTNSGGVATTGLPTSPRSTVPVGTVFIPAGTRPNPNLTGGFFWYTAGTSSYNALQVDVTKRFTQQLQFRANYTWSKSLDINSAPTGAQANNEAQMVLDRFDLRKDWGPSALNTTHQAHLTASYQLPFGRGQHWLADAHGVEDKLVSGWVFNTITTLLSGFPLTPLVGSNISGDGDSRNPDRPNLNTGPTVPCPQQINQWVNPCAYSLPVAGTYGNVGRGSLTGPGLVDVDVSMYKDTRLTEKVKMEFRAECFNVLNHTNFNTPNPVIFSNGAINPTAGQITSTATNSRQIQFGVKVIY